MPRSLTVLAVHVALVGLLVVLGVPLVPIVSSEIAISRRMGRICYKQRYSG